jgi:hypothetical protein
MIFKQDEYNLLLNRLYDNGGDTLGILYYPDIQSNLRYVFSLEDEYREVKKYGETRIPAGRYEIQLRKEGGIYDSYINHKNATIKALTKKYGMPEIIGIPEYKYVLIHIGNTDVDTAGCILIGNQAENNSNKKGFVSDSAGAYVFLVSAVYAAFEKSKRVFITVVDQDRDILKLFGVIK